MPETLVPYISRANKETGKQALQNDYSINKFTANYKY